MSASPLKDASGGKFSKSPRRYSAAALRAMDLLRWVGTHLWPGRALYGWWLARGATECTHEDIPVAGLPRALDGLRIVQLSDFHAGPFLDRGSMEPVLDLVRACQADLLVLTGDFITDNADDRHKLGQIFAQMPATLGKFAVFGNHDYRQRREGELGAWLRRQGVQVLRNASARVERAGASLLVAGLEDIEEGRRVDLEAALGSSPAELPTLLLCHHPDVADLLPPGAFDLVLCGHTHGGQVVLPVLGAVGRKTPVARLRGTSALPGKRGFLHVNRGLGVLVLPFRLGARPQVSCLSLRRVRHPGLRSGPKSGAIPEGDRG